MKDRVTQTLSRYQRSFLGFTAGQKVVAVVGTGALLLAAFLVFRWVTAPDYVPLYSDLSSEDASAVVDELDASGIPYELTGNGGTVMVPKDQVYATRIQLSGDGLPSDASSGYSLLDSQDLSTSEFQEQTDFKRAMEGELASTVEAIDGVDTAVVHLALPPKQVFASEQDPATASVLVDTSAGTTLAPEQVQAIVHLVASSIDGLDPENVTVADSEGNVLSSPDGEYGATSGRNQQVADYQNRMTAQIQAALDKVVGPGNSTVTYTADLDFDKATVESTTYDDSAKVPPLSSRTETEKLTGAQPSRAGGVVGPDGQMDPQLTSGGDSSKYERTSETADNAIGTVHEVRETAPGSVNSQHVGVIIDSSVSRVDPAQIQELIGASIGIDEKRGDTVMVSAVPFDRTAEEAAASELKSAAAAEKKADLLTLYRNIGIGLALALLALFLWLRSRKKAKARERATTYVVEQLREDAAVRAAQVEAAPAVLALEQQDAHDDLREELAALVERQPEDVATLLRGWLVERP